MNTRFLLIALSSLVLAPCTQAEAATSAATSTLPPTADYAAFGPFATISESNTGPDGTYTIVRPETLGKDGFVHAPIIFGPGIGGEVDSMTALLMGGTNDLMRDGQSWLAPTYEASRVQTFFALVEGANHGYPARSVDGVQSGVEAPAMIAWLRYWLYNDQNAKRHFFGDDCVLCSAPWTKTQRKNWP
jgi:hypothetical protein